MRKVFVEVIARFDLQRNIMPVSFVWEDGTEYEIDKIKDVKKQARYEL